MFQQRYPHITTLVAYGCSYTAGAELGDHLISPKAEITKRKKGLDHWYDNIIGTALYDKDPNLKRTVEEYELDHAWPSHVARALGLATSNRAIGGTSLGLAVWNFERDILERRVDAKNTLFVFGVTTADRIHLFGPSPANTLRMHGLAKEWHQGTILSIFTDAYLVWNHLQLLARLSALANQLDVVIAVFNMFGKFGNRVFQDYQIAPQDLVMFQHQQQQLEAAPGFFLLEPPMYSFITGPEEQLAFGHPTLAVHERYSKHVIDCLDRL